jgi:branched-chain amino acid transport system permease protein
VCAAGLAASIFVGRNIRRLRPGRNFVALRDNETHAQALGIRPVRAKLTAFALSGFFAAFAGALYAYHQQSLTVHDFAPEYSLFIFSQVVIGGMGSMTGAILGAVYIQGVQFFLGAKWQFLATGAGLLFLLLFFPGGLGEIVFRVRDRYLRWVAGRQQIVVPSLLADRRIEATLVGTPGAPGEVAEVAKPKRKRRALAEAGERP